MKFPDWIRLYGEASFRGQCPAESVEQMSFFNKIRKEFPDTYGAIAIHPRNEGLVSKGQFSAMVRHKAEGMVTGASDVIIPGRITFVCEIKRQDHTKSRWQDEQLAYLGAADRCGAFACVALGARAAYQAFTEWRELNDGH